MNLETIQEQLIVLLRRSVGLLGSQLDGQRDGQRDGQFAELKAEVIEACDRINHPTYRIAVFGPFNYGKSTLLNALLGEKALPMDLVPTTGAAITVKYGAEPRTRIEMTDGTVQEESGTSTLQDFAVLNEQRQMRADVSEVTVYCPHPLLKLGLELIDLPGTDDEQAQNDLVQQQLVSADLVIQLLDGRKLMTLAERENLRDWLLDRGINTVIFVVNFLNLMEAGDRQKVALRLRFLAESFRATLPDGVSNFYQVDALPALRARLKGDMAAAKQAGLAELETALQTIGAQMANGRPPEQTLPRLQAVALSVSDALRTQIDSFVVAEPTAADLKRVEIRKKAQGLIQRGFEQDIAKLRGWLTPQNLQANYRLGLANALENETTQDWLLQYLEPAWRDRKNAVVGWVYQACEMFDSDCPADLQMAFAASAHPNTAPQEAEPTERASTENSQPSKKEGAAVDEVAPVAIATGLGWILGGPMGAAVLAGTTHLLNQSGKGKSSQQKSTATNSSNTAHSIDFTAQADIYLTRFSEQALAVLADYEKEGLRTIQTPLSPVESTPLPAREAQLTLLKTTLEEFSELTDTLSSMALS
ncbi:MAG: dynamin family protein [Cyanobacteria bacterium J06649_4]